jgi:hypothetical protein
VTLAPPDRLLDYFFTGAACVVLAAVFFAWRACRLWCLCAAFAFVVGAFALGVAGAAVVAVFGAAFGAAVCAKAAPLTSIAAIAKVEIR